MRAFGMTRSYVAGLFILGLVLPTGCKKEEPKPESSPAVEATKPEEKAETPTEPPPAAEPEATPKPTEEVAAEKPNAGNKKDKLATAFAELYCAQRRNDATNLLELYKKHGFESPAVFSKEWDKTATDDSEWAETVVSGAMASDCAPPANP